MRIMASLFVQEFRHIAKKRIHYLYSSQPEPSQFTVLVRAIPKPSQQTYSEQVDDFFRTYYPDTYLLQRSVYANAKWQKLLVCDAGFNASKNTKARMNSTFLCFMY